METFILSIIIIMLISSLPLAYSIGRGTGFAKGYERAKKQFKNDKPLTDAKVNKLAKNICNSYKMN